MSQQDIPLNFSVKIIEHNGGVLCRYTEALVLAPDKDTLKRLYSNRSFAYAKASRYAESLADADIAVSLAPSWDKAHYRKGVALRGLKQHYDAAKAFRSAWLINKGKNGCSNGVLQKCFGLCMLQYHPALSLDEASVVQISHPLLCGERCRPHLELKARHNLLVGVQKTARLAKLFLTLSKRWAERKWHLDS